MQHLYLYFLVIVWSAFCGLWPTTLFDYDLRHLSWWLMAIPTSIVGNFVITSLYYIQKRLGN